MQALALLLLLLLASAVATAESSETESCEDCVEKPVDDDDDPLGACCFGDNSLGQYTEDRCNYAWAGPETSDEDCRKLRNCCFPQTGTCALKHCFECIEEGGYNVETCAKCHMEHTTTGHHGNDDDDDDDHHHSSHHHTLPPPPATSTGGTTTGCCCERGKPGSVKTAQDCHQCDGFYLGDGTVCDEDSCTAQCCHCGDRDCVECPLHYNPQDYKFKTFGTECPPEPCGVSCCLNGRAIEAVSSQQCLDGGGVPHPDTSLEETDCGGGCCIGLQFQIVDDQETCEQSSGTWLGTHVGYHPGVCGGACCVSAEECLIKNDTECANAQGVYQGDDVPCETDDDDDGQTEPDPNGQCENDGACCLPHGDGCVQVAHSRHCFKRDGVFLGAGSVCADDSCQGGVCCCGDKDGPGFAGVEVANEAECKLKHGQYAGDGSTLEMPAVCDLEGGACICDDSCLQVPSAHKCSEYHGSFRGTGTTCDDYTPPPENPEDEIACCMPTLHGDRERCGLAANKERCRFNGGIAQFKKHQCKDDTCAHIRGACCSDNGNGTFACRDHVTPEECHECGGHWGGAKSRCSDEYSCRPQDIGACCREGHDCRMATVTACHRDNGKFQGFNTTCTDNICLHCTPCDVSCESCSESEPCENPAATCVQEYGKCFIFATPIDRLEDDDDDNNNNGGHHGGPTKRGLHGHQHGPPGNNHNDDDDDLHQLSCGDNSTIGQPCIAPPLFGKCRIGVCEAVPDGVDIHGEQCKALCRQIVEYECECGCDGAWLLKCSHVAGRIIKDENTNNELDDGDTGVLGATVELYSVGEGGETDFISEKISDSTGRYAFPYLKAGTYKVRVLPPGCLAFENGVNHRFVTTECTEPVDHGLRVQEKYNSIRAPHSVQFEQHAKGSHFVRHDSGEHFVTDLDFLLVDDCEAAADQQGNADSDGDIGDAPMNLDSSSSESSSHVGLVVGLVLGGLCLCVIILLCISAIARSSGGTIGKKSSKRLK